MLRTVVKTVDFCNNVRVYLRQLVYNDTRRCRFCKKADIKIFKFKFVHIRSMSYVKTYVNCFLHLKCWIYVRVENKVERYINLYIISNGPLQEHLTL